jgi:hypothetical protein
MLSKVTPSPLNSSLLQRLVEEWRKPQQTGQPDIILDEQAAGGTIHLFVIWDDWRGLTQIERSEIVMDAFEQVHGPDEAIRVTVAMGLTSEESKQFKLPN